MRKTAQIMGIPISVDIPSATKDTVFDTAFKRLRTIDESFSTYKSNSELSLYRSGEIKGQNLSSQMLQVQEACESWQDKTDGYFSAWFLGKFDPTGYVKGWAMQQAGEVIKQAGFKSFCIGAGGDILAYGNKTWKIGLQNPFDKKTIINVIDLKNQAIATSGNYERGQHIINPKTKKPSNFWASITIVGPDIIGTDVLATACFAMEEKAPAYMAVQDKYEFLAVDRLGHIVCSEGLKPV